MTQAYKILIADLIGMLPNDRGRPDFSDVKQHIINKGGCFYDHGYDKTLMLEPGKLHFFYQPDLSDEQTILNATDNAQYDALIAAATYIPVDAKFAFGGVRIGAGTGNLASNSWGGGSGLGGSAPLMNTPGFNSRATAQMVMKALLRVLPDIDVQALHDKVVAGDFDTGRDLSEYPTEKLEGKRVAVLGYGNIGREVAKLAQAFAMDVVIYARETHRVWIESEGFEYADSIVAAVTNADVLTIHLGLGQNQANMGIIDKSVLSLMNPNGVLINYDRGELVDSSALDWALSTGQLRHGAIDADIFKDAHSGKMSGPMTPYLLIHQKHQGKLSLLPHAAADTEHHSRVAGAKQAVDQIFELILNRRVINRVGDIPSGYVDGGSCTIKGITKVTEQDYHRLSSVDRQQLAQLAGKLSEFFATDNDHQAQAKDVTLAANQLVSLLRRQGLLGPYE